MLSLNSDSAVQATLNKALEHFRFDVSVNAILKAEAGVLRTLREYTTAEEYVQSVTRIASTDLNIQGELDVILMEALIADSIRVMDMIHSRDLALTIDAQLDPALPTDKCRVLKSAVRQRLDARSNMQAKGRLTDYALNLATDASNNKLETMNILPIIKGTASAETIAKYITVVGPEVTEFWNVMLDGKLTGPVTEESRALMLK